MDYPTITMLDIELVNFSRIKSGMKIDRLYIDFTNFEERMFLFMGDNGSGKSSTMRCFHPFAFNSSAGDDGSNGELITPGKDGRKVVHYGLQNHIYTIQHIYTRKKDSLLVKSYIREDDVELNESGSVTLFKNLIESLFGLKESFLSLLSIGNTVDGFVRYTAGERKGFAMKIFQELSLYATFYKNASQKVRETKPLLANVTAKLEQYRNYNLDDLKSYTKQLRDVLEKLDEEHLEYMRQIGSVEQKIETNRDMIQNYDSKQSRIKELFEEISKKQGILSGKDDELVLQNRVEELQEESTEIRIQIASIQNNIASEVQVKDSKTMSLQSLEDTTNKMAMNTDIKSLIELKSKLELERFNLGLSEVERPKYTSLELAKSVIYLNQLKGMCIDLVTDIDDPENIPEVLKEFQEDPNTPLKLQRRYESAEYDIRIMSNADGWRDLLGTMNQIPIQCDCDKECDYKKFYQLITKTLKSSQEEVNLELRQKMKRSSEIKERYEISMTLKHLYQYLDEHMDEIHVPEKIFNRDTFVLLYMEDREVCDRKLLNALINLVEHFERQDQIDCDIEDTAQKIESLEQNRDLYNGMMTQIDQLTHEIENCDTQLDFYRRNLEYQTQKQDSVESSLSIAKRDLKVVQEVNTMRLEVQVLKEELVGMESKMSEIKEATIRYNGLTKAMETNRIEYNRTHDEFQTAQNTIEMIESLTAEQYELSRRLDIQVAIQKAVSPSKGLPVEFIDDFMKGEVLYEVNRLLNSVYHGKLQINIDRTVIDDNEFTIPYSWNGHPVSDICFASDGQKAIMTLAFSITLIKMTMGKYNIMLLDEMDTTLDPHSRAKSIELLENFAEEIHASQMFTISHNQMFDGRPIVVLLTTDEVVSNLPSDKIIRLYDGGNG